MPDPIDWGMVIESPQIWGASIGLIGIIIVQYVLNRRNRKELEIAAATLAVERETKKDEADLAAIRVTVGILRAEVERQSGDVTKLRAEVETLRADIEGTRKKYRILTEKFSSAIAYIVSLTTAAGGLFARLDAAGVPHGDIPAPPSNIVGDLAPSHMIP